MRRGRAGSWVGEGEGEPQCAHVLRKALIKPSLLFFSFYWHVFVFVTKSSQRPSAVQAAETLLHLSKVFAIKETMSPAESREDDWMSLLDA